MLCKLSRTAGIVLLLTTCRPYAQEPDQVTLQLNWTHGIAFAGFYVAQTKGYYEEENLTVTFQEGGFPIDVDPAQSLVSGAADFATLALAQHQSSVNSDHQTRAVMTVFQIPPLVLFALSDSGIRNPQDMIGRRVAIKTPIWRERIHSVLANAGIHPAEIIEVQVEPNDMDMLYRGEVDVWTGAVQDEPVQARLDGYEVNQMFLADYGVGVYEELLVVGQDTLGRNPDLVGRFVRASRRGWQYAVEHPDDAAEIITQWQPDPGLEFHQIGMRALVPLINTGHVPIGWIDAQRWQIALGEDYDPEQPGYTMEFVEER